VALDVGGMGSDFVVVSLEAATDADGSGNMQGEGDGVLHSLPATCTRILKWVHVLCAESSMSHSETPFSNHHGESRSQPKVTKGFPGVKSDQTSARQRER